MFCLLKTFLIFHSQHPATVVPRRLHSVRLSVRQNRPEEYAAADVHPYDSKLDASQQRTVLGTHLHRKIFGRTSNR